MDKTCVHTKQLDTITSETSRNTFRTTTLFWTQRGPLRITLGTYNNMCRVEEFWF